MTKSFKQMIREGEIKRADAMKVALVDVHEEPGFNERTEGPELVESIEQLAAYILAGGMIPPLEVRPREGGGVWIVDGHRRTRAYRLAVERGAPIEYVEVRAFNGNDVDRVARIASSRNGMPLSPLETSRVYKRLAAFGLSPQDIATKVGRTRAHVDQMLTLANANNDVQRMVQDGSVSATTAVKVVRDQGEQAGAVLGEHVAKAKAAGKNKATAGTIEGKPLPRKIVAGALSIVETFTKTLSTDAHRVLSTLNLSEPQTVEVDAAALLQLVEAQREVEEARKRQEEKARNKAAKAAQIEMAAA